MCSSFKVVFNRSTHLCFFSSISFCLFHVCHELGDTFAVLFIIFIYSTESKNGHQRVYILFASSGPKPCEACRQEEMYEEPISILNSSEVSQRVQYKVSVLRAVWPHNLSSGHLLRNLSMISVWMFFQSAAYTCCVWFLSYSVAVLHPQVFPDNAAGREIASLPARCLNEGCSWTGSIKQYEVSV